MGKREQYICGGQHALGDGLVMSFAGFLRKGSREILWFPQRSSAFSQSSI